MNTVSPTMTAHTIRFEELNWIGSTPLSRDKAQSHPSLEYGDLTMYFETDGTRMAYLDMPPDHPNPYLPYPARDSDGRGE